MHSPVLVIFLVIFRVAFAERDTPCITPNNENATCVSVSSCEIIVKAASTRNQTAVEFAKQSQCGYDTEPLVCCGSVGYPTITTTTITKASTNIFDIFSTPPPQENVESLLEFSSKYLPDRSICGLERTKSRIIGGTQTELDEFPWAAALEYISKRNNESEGVRCGGSLINKEFVMTAAHCLYHVEFKLVKVRLGEWKISEDPDCTNLDTANMDCADPVKIIEVGQLYLHPFYSSKYLNNDIGLVQLKEKVTYSDFVRPICLPPPNLPFPSVGTRMTVVGWGSTQPGGPQSDIKLKLTIPLQGNEECFKGHYIELTQDQLCAGGEQAIDFCHGNSGGPLMRIYEDRKDMESQWYLEGVTSKGSGGCGRVGRPKVYTRVSRYTNWILTTLSEG